jgi:hypothetical protein
MEWYGLSQAGSIKKIDRAVVGVRHRATSRLAAPGLVSRWPGQATDVAVAQPVVDQREQFAGGGDLADVRAASFADTDPGVPEGTLPQGLHQSQEETDARQENAEHGARRGRGDRVVEPDRGAGRRARGCQVVPAGSR